MKLTLFQAFVFVLLMSCWAPSALTQDFHPSFTESEQTTHKIPDGQQYRFGYLKVLENRQNPNSSTIELPVYIFKSRNKNPKKDPIIYTVGGPGYTTMPSAQYMKVYQYLDDRDFILIEQRGNTYARPCLDCPEWSRARYLSNLPGTNDQESDKLFSQAVDSCRANLISRGIDLNGYNTNEIAADINDLVTVLNLEQYNLLTISYSTKIAQVLLRDYPERIRSVVMDSPLPLEVNYDEESVQNLMETVKKLFSDCEADISCAEAFPNIKARFFQYLRDKSKNPLVVTIDNPTSGEEETFYLKGADLLSVFTLASTKSIGSVPFEANKLLNNDLSSIRERLKYVFQYSGKGPSMGMRLSVWCAEEHPFNDQNEVSKETYKYPEVTGLSPATVDDEICKIWSVKSASEIENQAIKSTIPVLLINGEYDYNTPVKWARSMMENLPYSFHLVFKGWTHIPTTNWGNSCAMQAANEFFNNPTEKPQPECLEQINGVTFKTE